MPTLTVLHGVRTLQLSRGQNTLIEEGDFGRVGTAKWCAHWAQTFFYAVRRKPTKGRKNGGFQYLHRVLLGTPPSKMHVDHINGDTLDNRGCNLRLATCSQNIQNSRRGRGKSRFKGVSMTTQSERWWAKIRVNGKHIYLGCFRTQEEAARAYDAAAREHFGEFACTNADMFGDY